MQGTFAIVRITASTSSRSASSSATVIANTIALNPLVFAVASAGGRVRLSAGTLEEGELQWSVTTATGARLEPPAPDGDELSEPGDLVYVRGDALSGAFFSVDQVTVQAVSGATATTQVLVVEKDRRGIIRVPDQTGARADQIQLEFDAGGDSPVEGADWKVQVGGGSITPEGLYTFDPASTLPYVVITAEYEVAGISFGNFLILPIPLVDLDAVRNALSER